MCVRDRCRTSSLRPSAIVPAAIALTIFACGAQSVAQITFDSVISAADLTQVVPGTCASYNSALTGAMANGRAHPGSCRTVAWTPLFNGLPLGTDLEAFLRSQHPPLFTTTTTFRGGQYCATNSPLKVMLSASLQATRLEWAGLTGIGSTCNKEVARVNEVSVSQIPTRKSQVTLDLLLLDAGRFLERSPTMTGCGPSTAAATLALDQQVWNRLQEAAAGEIAAFETTLAPAMDTSSGCAAKCNLCFKGWVGNITCTANIDSSFGTNNALRYVWNETQNWDIGGVPTTTMGGTTYPANFTATGNGSKQNGPSWNINGAQLGAFSDHGVNANKRFSTSHDPVPGAITWSDGTQPSADYQMQFQFNADAGGSTANDDPAPTLPTTCNALQKPGGLSCTFHCTRSLNFQ